MRELYDQLYGRAGWFSELTAKEQWFKQSLAGENVVMLSASLEIGFEIATPVQEVIELSASLEIGFDIETIVQEVLFIAASLDIGFEMEAEVRSSPSVIMLSASLPIGFEIDAELEQEPDNTRVVGGGFLGKRTPKEPIYLKASMELGFNVMARTTIREKLPLPEKTSPPVSPALPDYKPVDVLLGAEPAVLEPALATAPAPLPEVLPPPAPAPLPKPAIDWAKQDAEDLAILTL